MIRQSVKWSRLRAIPIPKPGSNNGHLILKYLNPDNTRDQNKPVYNHPIWVDEMTVDFALSGSTAQSVAKRDFYPRNFNQPSYSFHGQTFNERHYGRLGEFIRHAQQDCVLRNGIMQIRLPAAGATEVLIGPEGHQRRRTITDNQRGRRPAIWLEGYIQNIARSHGIGVQAPEYDFAFVVSRTLDGPIIEDPVSPNVLPRNWDSFIHRDGTGFIRNPADSLLAGDTNPKGAQNPPTRVPDREGPAKSVGEAINWDDLDFPLLEGI